MKDICIWIEQLISGMLPLCLLAVSGVYLTLKTRGYQFKNFTASLKVIFAGKSDKKGKISSFGATCNSLAATVGTGNISGVAAAISVGGAGAVFWMWASSLLSMVLKSAEIVLAIKFTAKKGENYLGGPMYYIINGMGKRFLPLAVLFSVAGVFSAFTTGNITQVNSSVAVIGESLPVRLIWGVILCVIVAVVIGGGMQKITRFTTVVMPLMAGLYIALCLSVVVKNYRLIDDAFWDILRGAISPKSVTGGAVGSVLTTAITGSQKGIFSNEAGLGTAALAHYNTEGENAKTEALFGVFEVFVDTLLICTLTALTILCSGVIIDYESVASSSLVADALATLYGGISAPLLSLMLLLFGVASVIGWAAYGIACANFLLKDKGGKIFVIIYPLFCVMGAVIRVDLAWRMAEFFNALMLIANLFAVLMLSKNAVDILGENYENKRIAKQIRRTPSGTVFRRR